jgi:hypothetical protein
MDMLSSYNSVLQVIAAFVIFIVGYLALFFLVILCLLVAEAVRQGFIFARASLRSPNSQSADALEAPAITSAGHFSPFGWAHKFTGALIGAHKQH